MIKGLRSNKKKSLTAALLLAVLVIAVVGGTVAYIHYDTEPVTNDFASAKVDTEIVEQFSGSSKTSVTVKNTNSTYSVYIRVAVIANTVNEAGNITGDASDKLTGKLPADGWTMIGNYYYYNSPVNAEGSTTNLLSAGIDLDGIQVTVLSDAIQAAPAKAVEEAWGVAYGQNGPAKAASN